ncbi:MAG: hypothetical protein LBT58_04050 [Endomicrobium sp.]|nr:hypothetical protein [Endomicrobium sp.]
MKKVTSVLLALLVSPMKTAFAEGWDTYLGRFKGKAFAAGQRAGIRKQSEVHCWISVRGWRMHRRV